MIGRKKKEHSDTESMKIDENAGEGMGDVEASSSDTPPDETAGELEALQIERDEAIDRYQRALADFRNFQRRSVQNEISAAERAKQDLIRELIPVLDNFDLAIGHAGEGSEQSVEATLKGVSMVRDILMQTLLQKGLTKVAPKRGEVFDPNYHEAMMKQPTDEVEPGHIVNCIQVGYRMGETTLRPAKVIIAEECTQDTPQASDESTGENDHDNTEA